jgi:putative phage-type endonuclease
MRIVKNLEQRTLEWHQFRQQGLGASDVAALITGYKTPMQLYKEKTSSKPSDFKPNAAMQRGIDNEDIAREEVSKQYFHSYEPICVIHDEHDWARASLDGYCYETGDVLEIKVPTERNFDSYFDDEVPDNYMVQVQWQLFVTGSKQAIFCAYSPELKYAHTIKIERNEALISKIYCLASDLWVNHVQPQIPPPSSFIHVDDAGLEELSKEWEKLDIQEKEMQKPIKEIAERKDALKKKIIEFGDDGDFVACNRILCKRVFGRLSYDIEAMKKDGINVDKYQSQSIGYYSLKRLGVK